MSQRFCPECGGPLHYDPPSKRFICKSCGLYATREELERLRERPRVEEDERRRRKRLHSEYLEWWLSSKEDKRR